MPTSILRVTAHPYSLVCLESDKKDAKSSHWRILFYTRFYSSIKILKNSLTMGIYKHAFSSKSTPFFISNDYLRDRIFQRKSE